MASVKEIMQLCRLCLVKDHVNVPIFEEHADNRQISMKISTCLPVKVSKDDNLPKKVCDGCSCKLDMLYEFYNTSASSEKQLLEWLDQANVNEQSTTATDILIQYPHSIDEDLVKQEVIDIDETQANGDFASDDLNVPVDSNYLLQESFEFEQAATSSTAQPSATVTSATVKAAPKRKRRAAALKPLPPQTNSEDEDDVDAVETKVAKIMACSAKERTAAYRHRLRQDPVRWERHLQKERERSKKRRQELKKVFSVSKKNRDFQRAKERERKRRSRQKLKDKKMKLKIFPVEIVKKEIP